MLEKGPWIVLGHYLTVSKWKPNLTSSMESIHSTTVWVRLPELPIEFFNKELLLRIENHTGKAVRVDSPTSTHMRGRFARLREEEDCRAAIRWDPTREDGT